VTMSRTCTGWCKSSESPKINYLRFERCSKFS
jgi:hypothetical protein